MEPIKIYNNIIEKALNENRSKLNKTNLHYVYYEKHHIMPKCLGGDDHIDNLVLLTAREHFICHKLLVNIYPNNKKLIYAYTLLAFNKKAQRKISSREYELAKSMRKIPLSDEIKKKISNGRKNQVPWNKGIKTGERTSKIKEKIKTTLFGIKHTEERKKNISESLKGHTPWNKGKKLNGGKNSYKI